jgi:hypothetical protein
MRPRPIPPPRGKRGQADFLGLRNWKSSSFNSLNLEASGFLAEQRKKVK